MMDLSQASTSNFETDRPLVSLILPAYNSAPFLEQSVTRATNYFKTLNWSYEIICVDDGSVDQTSNIIFKDDCVRMLRHPKNCGKGAAIRTGMMASSGKVRIMTDSDLPYGFDCMAQAVYYILLKDYHLVIGDRLLENSIYHKIIDWRRRVASHAFSFIVGRMITGGFYDTQCGFKAVRGDVAAWLFPRLRIDRFACDVELIYASLINNLDIKRIPMVLACNETSSVRLGRDSLQTLIDVLRMKYIRTTGAYRSEKPISVGVVSPETAVVAVEDYCRTSDERSKRILTRT